MTLPIVHFINMESDMEISDYELEMESSMDSSVSDFLDDDDYGEKLLYTDQLLIAIRA